MAVRERTLEEELARFAEKWRSYAGTEIADTQGFIRHLAECYGVWDYAPGTAPSGGSKPFSTIRFTSWPHPTRTAGLITTGEQPTQISRQAASSCRTVHPCWQHHSHISCWRGLWKH